MPQRDHRQPDNTHYRFPAKDGAPTATHNLRLIGQIFEAGQIGRIHRLGHKVVAAQDKTTPFTSNMSQRGLPAIAGVGGWSQVDVAPPRLHQVKSVIGLAPV